MKTKKWSARQKLNLAQAALLDKAIGLGMKRMKPAMLKPKDGLAKHREQASNWLMHVASVAALYDAAMAGRIVLRFTGDSVHPMNPDTMEIHQIIATERK